MRNAIHILILDRHVAKAHRIPGRYHIRILFAIAIAKDQQFRKLQREELVGGDLQLRPIWHQKGERVEAHKQSSGADRV
jgi:hypothetical protein